MKTLFEISKKLHQYFYFATKQHNLLGFACVLSVLIAQATNSAGCTSCVTTPKISTWWGRGESFTELFRFSFFYVLESLELGFTSFWHKISRLKGLMSKVGVTGAFYIVC